jgi:hypothetical protein
MPIHIPGVEFCHILLEGRDETEGNAAHTNGGGDEEGPLRTGL